MANDQQTAKTFQAIAAMLVDSPAEGSEDVSKAKVQDEAEEAELVTDDNSPDEGTSTETDADDGQDEGEDVLDEGETVEDEGTEEDEGNDEEVEPQEFVIQEDDVLEVMIDGKLETRTIAELKKAAAGEGAIEKRLQEATEVRKTAHAERTTILENLFAQEAIVTNVLANLDGSVFVGLIPKPNDALKAKNPALYLQQMEAYEYDQKRITTAKSAVEGKIKELQKQRQDRLQEYAKAAAAMIAKDIPELVSPDPTVSQKTFGRMVEVAKSYGYTEQEINSALDPRMFRLVRDAMRLQELTSKSKEIVKDVKNMANGTKPIRKLTAGTTKAKTVAVKQAKQAAEAKNRAKQTGAIKDVAATLLKR